MERVLPTFFYKMRYEWINVTKVYVKIKIGSSAKN